MITLLAVDDDPQNLDLIAAALRHPEVTIVSSTDPQDALELFFRTHPRLVLLDLMMPGISGMEILEQIVAADPEVEVILLTGDCSTVSAVEAIQKGACDYITKPVDFEKLRARVLDSLARVKQQPRALDPALLNERGEFQGIIGRSPAMLEVFARIQRTAPHFSTALVTGPTGSGKELVASALHRLSSARAGRYAICNCAAITETLVESELFGYVRGAFTGANQDKPGLFEYANGGTVFLDEIGDLAPAAQAKLLRVLQHQEVQRVGSPVVRKVDVRVIAATNRDLRAMAAEKTFRDDLYYRLSMVEIKLPGLAERKQDLPLLMRRLLEKFNALYKKDIKGISRRARGLLERYAWPGNVRELENVLGNACMMCEGDCIDVCDLPQHLRQRTQRAAGMAEGLSLDEFESRYARDTVDRVGGNKARAAEILSISRTTLYKLLRGSNATEGQPEDRGVPDQFVTAFRAD